jgi:hypothetical protein
MEGETASSAHQRQRKMHTETSAGDETITNDINSPERKKPSTKKVKREAQELYFLSTYLCTNNKMVEYCFAQGSEVVVIFWAR